MRFAVIVLSAVILLLLAGVVPVGGGLSATAVYYSPVMMVLLALLSGGCVVSCFRRRSVGFVLVHIGVVMILIGAFVGYLFGTKGTLRLSLRSPQAQTRLLTQDRETVAFGFSVAAEDFEVEFYPPVYKLFRPLPPEQVKPGRMPFEQDGEYRTDGVESWMIDGREVAVSSLWKNGAWTERVRLDDGSVLFHGPQTPSFYGVTLLANGEKLPVSINHPAGYKGWRFYLESFDPVNRSYVVLSARRDPGRGAVIAGIWVVMIGMFVLCFRRAGGGEAL